MGVDPYIGLVLGAGLGFGGSWALAKLTRRDAMWDQRRTTLGKVGHALKQANPDDYQRTSVSAKTLHRNNLKLGAEIRPLRYELAMLEPGWPAAREDLDKLSHHLGRMPTRLTQVIRQRSQSDSDDAAEAWMAATETLAAAKDAQSDLLDKIDQRSN